MSRTPLSAPALALAALAVLPLPAAAQSAVPTFNDRTVEISGRHVTAVLAGFRMQNDSLQARWNAYLTARRAYDDSMQAHPRLTAEYEQKRAAFEACHEQNVKPQLARAERESEAAQAAAMGGRSEAEMEAAMQKVAERVKAAQQRGDMAEVMRLADSVQKAMAPSAMGAVQASQRAQAASESCGQEPKAPKHPTQPFYDRSVPPVPLDPALWKDSEQYGVMFDRLEPLLSIENEADFDRALKTAFSPREQQAIAPHAPALRSEMQRQRKLLENG